MGTVFQTTDIEHAAHILSSSYGSLKLDGRGQQGAVRLAQAALSPSVRFDHNSFAMSFDTSGTRLDVLLIGHLRSGRVAYHFDGGERFYQPGDVFLAVPPGHHYRWGFTGSSRFAAHLPARLRRQPESRPAPGLGARPSRPDRLPPRLRLGAAASIAAWL